MPAKPVTDDKLQAVVDAYEECGHDATRAADKLGVPRSTFRGQHAEALRKGLTPNVAPPSDAPPKEKFERSGNDTIQSIESVSTRIRTVADALDYARVDLAIWEVERFIVNSWEVAMKLKRNGEHEPRVQQLFQVKVWLKRKVAKPIEDAVGALMDRMKRFAPKYPKITRPKLKGRPFMLEVSPYDVHHGKRAPGYGLAEASHIFRNAFADILAKASPYNVTKFVVPIGNDYLHIDNARGTTTGGTYVDPGAGLAEIIDSAVESFRLAIDRMLAVAPVHIPFVPGNHDRWMGHCLARELKAWYRNVPDVTVDVAASKRKIITFGANGVMLAHGDTEPLRDLPITMAAEDRDAWGRTSYNEVHCGHFHKKKIVMFTAADTHGGGVVVRYLPSLSAADDYHIDHGWSRTPRAMEAYLWPETPGLEAYFNAPARAA